MANHQAAAEVLGGNEARFQVTFGAIGGDAPLRPMFPVPTTQTGQADVVIKPNGSAHYSRGISIAPGEFVSPSSHLPRIGVGQRVIVTQSLASALAVEHATGSCAVAAIEANNLCAVAGSLKGAGCEVLIVPDNSDLSRAAARDAAHETRSKLVNPPYAPGPSNLLGALAESYAAIRERFPAALDPRRAAKEEIAMRDFVGGPIDCARPWTPGVGRSERIDQAPRAMSAGAEIGR